MKLQTKMLYRRSKFMYKLSGIKDILGKLPDDMLIVMPVIDEDDANHIYGFRKIRTAGILVDDYETEDDKEVLCVNAAADDNDIADQVHFSGKEVSVKSILFGYSKYEKEKENED